MDYKKELLSIGRISTSHGIKGEVKLKINDNLIDENNWNEAVLFLSNSSGQIVPVIVSQSYYKNNHLILKLKDYNSINEIQNILGNEVLIKKGQTLVSKVLTSLGYKVFSDGKQIGTVIEEMSNSAQKILRINLQENNKNFLVPVVEKYVKHLNYDTEEVILENIEELM